MPVRAPGRTIRGNHPRTPIEENAMTTSSTTTTTVAEIYAAFGRGDVPAILDALAENVAWEQWPDNYAQRAGVAHLLPRRGPGQVAEFFTVLAE
jgi:ketosteroid isomerase-like protein